MKILSIILIAITSISLTSCGTSKPSLKKGTVKISKLNDEIFTKPTLKDYLSKIDNPTVIVRGKSRYKISEPQINSFYNVIEKELSYAGFEVRDRSLFDRFARGKNYQNLRDKTNTDLIIEVVNFGQKEFLTNRYYRNEKEKTLKGNLKLIGYFAEFKIINLAKNEIVGNYTFYKTPCIDGCNISFYSTNYNELYDYNSSNNSRHPFEAVSENQLEVFFKHISKELTAELTKYKNN